jgi:hypothetical protein
MRISPSKGFLLTTWEEQAIHTNAINRGENIMECIEIKTTNHLTAEPRLNFNFVPAESVYLYKKIPDYRIWWRPKLQ